MVWCVRQAIGRAGRSQFGNERVRAAHADERALGDGRRGRRLLQRGRVALGALQRRVLALEREARARFEALSHTQAVDIGVV